MYNFIQEENGI